MVTHDQTRSFGEALLIGAMSGLLAGVSGLIVLLTMFGNLNSAIAYTLFTLFPMGLAELIGGSLGGVIGWRIGHLLRQERWGIRLGGIAGGLIACGTLLLFFASFGAFD